MLSLQSSKISLGSCFLCCSSFGLLNSLSSEEFLFHLFSLSLLSSFFLLELFKLNGSSLRKNFFSLSFLFGWRNLSLELFILLNLNLSALFLLSKFFQQLLLLFLLLWNEIRHCFALSALLNKSLNSNWLGSFKSHSLLVGLFGSFLQSLFHSSKLLEFVGTGWFLDSLNRDG